MVVAQRLKNGGHDGGEKPGEDGGIKQRRPKLACDINIPIQYNNTIHLLAHIMHTS